MRPAIGMPPPPRPLQPTTAEETLSADVNVLAGATTAIALGPIGDGATIVQVVLTNSLNFGQPLTCRLIARATANTTTTVGPGDQLILPGRSQSSAVRIASGVPLSVTLNLRLLSGMRFLIAIYTNASAAAGNFGVLALVRYERVP